MRKSSTSKPARRRQNSAGFADLAARSNYVRHEAITCLAEGRGRARLRLPVRPRHKNAAGTLHGGVIAALADTACGVALLSVVPAGAGFVTANLNVSYLAAPAGTRLEAAAKVVSARKRMAFAEAVVTDETGAAVARAAVVFYVSAP